MVLQLLPFGRWRTEERPPGKDQVVPLQVFLPVDQEILLLRPHAGDHPLRLCIPEQPHDTQRLLADGLHGAKQRRLLIQRLALVRTERGRDAQDHARGVLLQKGRGGHIPCGIAPRLKGCP